MTDPETTYACRVWAEQLENGGFIARSSVIQAHQRRYTSVSIEVEQKEFGAEEAAIVYGKKQLREMLEKRNPGAVIRFTERKSE